MSTMGSAGMAGMMMTLGGKGSEKGHLVKDQVDFKTVLRAIKTVLKSKKIHYRDLAARVGMSESGIKKLFISEDCSFNRLVQICNAVEISLTDVLESLRQSSVKEVRFTPEQQEYFIKNMDCFRFFWKLVYERMGVDEIQKAFSLTDREVFKYLKKLDELRLIQLHQNNRVKIPRVELIQWMGDGPLLRRIRKDWGTYLINEVIDGGLPQSTHFSLRYYQLTEESMKELLDAMSEIDLEFGKRTVREINLHKGKLKSVRTVSVVAPGSFVHHLGKPLIEEG